MAFTTQIFTFLYFPIAVILISITDLIQNKGVLSKFLTKIRASDILLITLSLAFYAWACFDDVFKFIFYILSVYLMGLLIEVFKNKENKISKTALTFSIIVLTVILIYLKYMGLLSSVINIIPFINWQLKSPAAILGISFITFSSVSYLVDIYKGKAAGRNFIDSLLYISFFPKVVSGPIVLYRDFAPQIRKRKMNLEGVSKGLSRLMIGFAKKVILADTFGAAIAKVPDGYIDICTAWGVALLYMLQIYYDFSGYSDIAIGLSNILGFDFNENFNFPYVSTSITEFWRRWHISLGTWFREYIYFPLGGSRKGKWRTVINIGVVFILTGIWHGAGWTYMLWGIINGVCNIIEKLLSGKKIYENTPKFIKWIFTMGVTFFSWEVFRFESIRDVFKQIGIMFGLLNYDIIPYTWQYYFDTRLVFLIIIGIIGSTLFGISKVRDKAQAFVKTKTGFILEQILYIFLFILSIIFMVNSTYSPFIYFRY